MFTRIQKIYNQYWLDIGVVLLVALLLGSGLLLIKISKEGKQPIEITGTEENQADQKVKAAVEDREAVDESEKQNGLVNINTASQSELESLPGIGEKTAEKIIDYREENGDFKTKEDLKNVSGIGDAKYSEIEDLITVE